MYHEYSLTRAAAEQFHQRLDQADYDAIYEDATDAFRGTGTHADFVKVLENIHQKMGTFQSMSSRGFHVYWQGGRLAVDQEYATHFSSGEGQETFIWMVENDVPRLQRYHIDSTHLR
jgi:hypothetical protein